MRRHQTCPHRVQYAVASLRHIIGKSQMIHAFYTQGRGSCFLREAFCGVSASRPVAGSSYAQDTFLIICTAVATFWHGWAWPLAGITPFGKGHWVPSPCQPGQSRDEKNGPGWEVVTCFDFARAWLLCLWRGPLLMTENTFLNIEEQR